MPRKTKAQLEAETEAARLQLLADDARQTAVVLRDMIIKLRAEGWQWERIGKAIGLPGYCAKVVAGEIAANRQAPGRYHYK